MCPSSEGWAFTKKGEFFMSYTDRETAIVVSAAPLTYETAVALAEKLNKSTRSVISKAKSLGLDYTPKAPVTTASAKRGPTKAQIMADIRSALALPEREGDLTKDELVKLLSSIR
jgi:hypothetical protein